MNKLFTKIAALSVGLAMAVGVGVAVGSGVRAASATTVKAYELDGTVVTSSSGDPTYQSDQKYDIASTATQNGLSWSVTGNTTMNPWRIGGKGDKNYVTNTFDRDVYSNDVVSDKDIKTVKVSIGTISASNLTINSYELIVSSEENGGGTVESSISETGAFSANADIEYSRPDGKDWSSKFFKFTVNVSCKGGKSSASNVFFQLKGIVFEYEESLLAPDSVEVSGESTLSVGSSTAFSSVAKKNGSSTGVNQNVTWTSSNESVAKVSDSGVVTGIKNGNATIRATSEDSSSVYGEKTISVTDGKDDDSALVLVPDSFPAAYGDTYITASGVYLHAKQIMKNDGMIQIQKTNGLLETVSAFDDEIATIELSFNSGKPQGTGYTVQASSDGESYDNLESEQYKDAYHLVYDVPAGKYFFKITGPTANTLYLDEILIGFGNSDETKLVALANTLNGLLDGECEGADDKSKITAEKWADVADAFDDGDAGAKSMLEAVGSSKSYQSVNLFLARYDHIVSAYGYNNFLSREYASETIRNFTTVDNGTSTIIIIVASMVTMSSFAFVLLLRKKKHMK